MKKNKNLDEVSRHFATCVTRSPKQNLTLAGGIFLGTFTLSIAISALVSYMYTWQIGNDFKQEWRQQHKKNFPAEILVPLAFGVLFLLSTVLESSGAKEEAKRFSELVLERYMKNAHFDTSNVKERYLHDAAELLIANMPQSMRDEIVEIGTELDNQLDSRSFVKNQKTRAKLFKTAIDEISVKIDMVLADNPDLEQSILYVLQGVKPMPQSPVKEK